MENMSSYRETGGNEGMVEGWTDVLLVRSQLDRFSAVWTGHIYTLTPCGLQRSNLGAGEPKGIHT